MLLLHIRLIARNRFVSASSYWGHDRIIIIIAAVAKTILNQLGGLHINLPHITVDTQVYSYFYNRAACIIIIMFAITCIGL